MKPPTHMYGKLGAAPRTVSGRAMPRTKKTSAVCANTRRQPWICVAGADVRGGAGGKMSGGEHAHAPACTAALGAPLVSA